MEDAGVLALIAIPIRGIIGYLIGRNRKIGGGWSAVGDISWSDWMDHCCL